MAKRHITKAASETKILTAVAESDVTPVLVDVMGIEIAQVGEEWPAMTGPFTVTTEDFESIIASQEDPSIKSPRVKLGHMDPRFTPDGVGLFDGTPVFGKFTNLRLSADRSSLIGDIVGIPKWTADVLPYAWPSRSGEWAEDVTTPTGRQWPMILTAVSLLGIELPAISTIEDLPALFTATGPDGVRVVADGAKIRASAGKEHMPKKLTSVGGEEVRQSFFNDFATADSGRWYWWPTKVLIDPQAVLAVDDDTGHEYYVEYTISGDDIEWGEPEEVKHQFVSKENGKVLAGQAKAEIIFRTAAEARPVDRQQKTNKTKEENGMTPELIKRLRELHGLTVEQLPDDATEEKVQETLNGLETPKPEDEPDDNDTSDDDDEPEAEGDEEEIVDDGKTVVMSKAQFEAMQKRLTSVEEREKKRTASETRKRRDEVVNDAIRTGRIARSEREFYRDLLDVNEEKTAKKLSSLKAGIVPVDERGESPQEDPEALEGTGFLPELNTTKED